MLTHKSVPFGRFLHEYLFGSSCKVLKTIKCVWILKETNVPILPIGNPIFAIMTFRQSCLKFLFERPLLSIILFQAYQSSSSDMLFNLAVSKMQIVWCCDIACQCFKIRMIDVFELLIYADGMSIISYGSVYRIPLNCI